MHFKKNRKATNWKYIQKSKYLSSDLYLAYIKKFYNSTITNKFCKMGKF